MLVIGCKDGTYGYKCMNNCSGNCLNNSPCHKKTGHCDGGCKPGYTNGSCSKGNSKEQSYILLQRDMFSVS